MMKAKAILAVGVVALLSVLKVAPIQAAISYFQPLGGVSGHVDVKSISPDGSAVAGEVNNQAFVWTQETGILELGEGIAYGVSDGASVVVGSLHGQAVRWTSLEGVVVLGDLPGGDINSYANDVSADGTVIVGSSKNTAGWHGFVWTASAEMKPLPPLSGYNLSSAEAVSADGRVIVGNSADSDGASQICRWSEDNEGNWIATSLGDIPGGSGRGTAMAASTDGTVIVGHGYPLGGYEGFRWTSESGMVGLGDLPGGSFHSPAEAVSGDGSVIVGLSTIAWPSEVPQYVRAYIWTSSEGMRVLEDVLQDDYRLDLMGWKLTNAFGVSSDGKTIVGRGIRPDGMWDGWIAYLDEPAPEPATLSLLALGGLALFRRRRAR